MDGIREVKEIKGCNLHDVPEEDAGVGRHFDLEEGHHHDQLLGVDHSPQLVERC